MNKKELKPNAKYQTLTSNVAITLIALVITIIVMLILVGVTVNIAINGGLFSTAKKAVTKTEEAKDSELRFMAMANAATHNEKWVYEVDGEKIPIPAGFAPTEIEGENTLDEGLVIIDTEGNEFVWIPCSSTEYESAKWNTSDNWQQWKYNDKKWTDSQTETGKESLEKLEGKKNAGELTDNGVGFYIARYEAGIPKEATEFYASKEGDSYKLSTEKNKTENGTVKYKPVSKKGYPAWNFINQTNAKTVSENMYKNNTTVNSYLIDSHAWNYICKNILESKDKENKNIKNSTDWGNHVNTPKEKYENLDVLYAVHELNYINWSYKQYADGDTLGKDSKYHKGSIPEDVMKARTGKETSKLIELVTGASEDFKAYNIYDMAGNMWEWTTETSDNCATARGGGFNRDGSSHPVVYADGSAAVGGSGVPFGFRVVLYL